MRPTRRRSLLGATVLVVVAWPVRAQAPTRLDSALLMRTADRGERRTTTSDERELEAVVVRAAEPRSYRLVRIEVPADVMAAGVVSYDVVSLGLATVLGGRHGIVVRDSAAGAALLTVGIPSTALAGRATVAYVRFSAPNVETVRVPVQIDVMSRRALRVSPAQPMRGARAGDRMELAFQIFNSGNVSDTVRLSLEVPESWDARLLSAQTVVVAPGEAVERRGRVTVPARWDGGVFTVALVAQRHGENVGRASTIVELSGAGGARGMSSAGPSVTLGIGSVAVSGVAPRAVESVSFDGAVSDALAVRGQLTTPAPNRVEAERALATMGYSSQANAVSLIGSSWTATGGATGAGLNDIAGETIFGRGASARWRVSGADVQAVAVEPIATTTGLGWGTPTLFGAVGSMRVSSTTFSAFMSHLRDSGFVGRELDATGVGAEVNPWFGASMSAQVAERRYRDGNGLGLSSSISGPIAGADVDIRMLRAPGGSAAFAPSQNGLTASASRSFSRFRGDASYWSAHDGTSQLSIGSDGWSLSPTYLASQWLSVGLDLRRSGYTSDGVAGIFSQNQTEYGARMGVRALGFDGSADTRYASIERGAASPDANPLTEYGRRLTNRARLDHGLLGGVAGVGGSLESAVDAAGASPVQTAIDAHAERLAPFGRASPLTISGAVQRLQYGSAVLTTSRLQLDVALRQGFRMVAGWERGAFRGANGETPSIATLRLERTATLPRLGQRLATGVVFEDRNGNGVRDPGEPGVAGVVVRRGGTSSVTDASGSFRFAPGGSGLVEIDPRSLPDGWLQSPRTLTQSGEGLAFGVIPTSSIEVMVALAPNPESGASLVRIGVATLTLRDSAGRSWVVRTGAVPRATFDAVPKGYYTLTAELEGSSEPLVVDPIPRVEVDGTPGRRQVTITVRTRPVRLFRPKA